ncbi:hypothetical protein [Streptomyces erythrochromogenes]|uniref:hypothetical protein n=1 Tax=Streptomyces erythrochromogenes TaxID=285574 RepID=UPI00224EC99D|nr:hypothetical protein [Streptomyces erythrochromogenes]MCX5584411.1 hypothetical protein [Streptomyces erythrochromogenes]
MRLGTTAAVFVGALALVLPTAGPSLADDQGDRTLGTLYYRYLDDAGRERQGRIRPADDGTCYLLTGTSRNEPAVDVRNRTRSRALLFDNAGCSGRAVATLRPNVAVSDVEVVAAFFKPVDEAGQEPGRGDWGNGGDQNQGRGDQNDEDAADESDGADQGQGRGDWGNGGDQGQGRGDQADAEEGAEEEEGDEGEEEESDVEEDFLSMVLRAVG